MSSSTRNQSKLSTPPFGFKTHKSKIDRRDHKDHTLAQVVAIPDKYITDLSALDVRMQYKIGKCVGESTTKGTDKLIGDINSDDFTYLGTKIKIDGNLNEGTSIRNALKFLQNYGVCKRSTFFVYTNNNTQYSDYIKSLPPQVAYNEAVTRKIGRYSPVPIDISLIKAAIYKYGFVIARMDIGEEWYTPSWSASDIMPLKKPRKVISGHAIVIYGYETTPDNKTKLYLANSWSNEWGDNGNGWFIYEDYQPTEAWIMTMEPVPLVDKSPYISDNIINIFLTILRKLGIIN